jgi:hypothetical protein
MLIKQHIRSCLRGRGPTKLPKSATDWIDGYRFTDVTAPVRSAAFESLISFEDGPSSAVSYDTSDAGQFVHAVAFALVGQTLEANSRTAIDDSITPWAGGILGQGYYKLAATQPGALTRPKFIAKTVDR